MNENAKKGDRGLIALIAGATLNLFMALIKFYVGFSSNCISILADGYNNAADFAGNVLGAIGWRLSRKKPDQKYPHGYQKIEILLTFVVVTISLAVGVYFIYGSVERLFFRVPISFLVIDFILVAVTALVKVGLFFIYRALNAKNPSPLLAANKLDSIMDATITACTLLAYGLGTVMSLPVDAFVGIGIGIAIVITMAKLWRKNVKRLLGADEGEILTRVLKIAQNYTQIDQNGVDVFISGDNRIIYLKLNEVDSERANQIKADFEKEFDAEVRFSVDALENKENNDA